MATKVTKWTELKGGTVSQLEETLQAMDLDADINAGASDYSDITTVTIRRNGKAVQFYSSGMYVRVPAKVTKPVFRVKVKLPGHESHQDYNTQELADAARDVLIEGGLSRSAVSVNEDKLEVSDLPF